MKSIHKYFRIDRREVYFLKFIFESYDGIAAITTVDPKKGLVLLQIAPGCEAEAEMILEDLGRDMPIEPMQPG